MMMLLSMLLIPSEAMTTARVASLDGGFIKADAHGRFVDEHGRVRIFHGGNRVMKATPWYFADQVRDDTEFELMQRMGWTVLRLGFMWSGYNPAPGNFNQNYIDIVKGIVGRAAAHGIYVLLDMHEDVMSSKFCLYDGVPLWVVNKSVPKHPFPWPLKGDCASRGWMMNTLTEAAAHAYQDLYDNTGGMLDDLAHFWAASAQQFANVSSVIGYEIINEPFAGDFYADPEVLLPGVAGKRNLQRMYDHVAPYIRQHDERHMIFYEPVTWGMITDNQIVGSGFDHVPGGTEYADRSAFSYHYYCDSFVPSYADKPVLTKVVCDEAIAPLVWRAVQEETARLGGGAMMTEGMACDFSKNESARECEAVLAQLDAHLLSFTDYGVSQGATFEPIPQQQEGWARTHAQAIAGTPLNMTFDPTTKDFEFCFTPDASLTVPTIIFASLGYSYPTGRHITTTPNLEVVDAAAASEGDLIAVTPARDAAPAVACVWVSRS